MSKYCSVLVYLAYDLVVGQLMANQECHMKIIFFFV